MKEIDVPMGDGSIFRVSINNDNGTGFNGMIDHVTVTASFICNKKEKSVCNIDCTYGAGYMRNDLTVTTYAHRDGSVRTNTVRPFVQRYIDIMEDADGGYMLRVIDTSTDQQVDMFCDSSFPTVEAAEKMRDVIIRNNPDIVWTVGVE